jgi:hypothetical protein
MSTIDRVCVYDKPCPCGCGRIVITECSPDHPYAKDSQTWYVGKVECDHCRKIYKMIENVEDDCKEIILKPSDDSSPIKLKSINRFCRGLSK